MSYRPNRNAQNFLYALNSRSPHVIRKQNFPYDPIPPPFRVCQPNNEHPVRYLASSCTKTSINEQIFLCWLSACSYAQPPPCTWAPTSSNLCLCALIPISKMAPPPCIWMMLVAHTTAELGTQDMRAIDTGGAQLEVQIPFAKWMVHLCLWSTCRNFCHRIIHFPERHYF